MDRKYQIFVSSTYEDLRDQRNEVIKACLNMGHIPVGMEMFNAADEEQWQVITRTIDQSDYYVVIVAHRYGSTTSERISFTEKEYDYAVLQGVPVLGFVIADRGVAWPPEWIDKDPKAVNALECLRSKVKQKMIRTWQNASELRALFVESLTRTIQQQPRRGWMRAPEVGETVDASLERDQLLRARAVAQTSPDRECMYHAMRKEWLTSKGSSITGASLVCRLIASGQSRVFIPGNISKRLQLNEIDVRSFCGELVLDGLIETEPLSYHLTETGKKLYDKLRGIS